ncbi:MAG: GlsB/YeaQ/YmgE family stress response membrane protein [Acidobacteriia bacterium]|nr:GlsB/YeaQ/YmgE family stress response membrane protein [Terriglobia bacterium]
MFHLLWSIVVGFVVGLIARAIMPGVQHMGLIATTLVGIVGSLLGGVIGGVIWRPKEGAKFHPAGFFLSLVGAVIVLFLWQHFVH